MFRASNRFVFETEGEASHYQPQQQGSFLAPFSDPELDPHQCCSLYLSATFTPQVHHNCKPLNPYYVTCDIMTHEPSWKCNSTQVYAAPNDFDWPVRYG